MLSASVCFHIFIFNVYLLHRVSVAEHGLFSLRSACGIFSCSMQHVGSRSRGKFCMVPNFLKFRYKHDGCVGIKVRIVIILDGEC